MRIRTVLTAAAGIGIGYVLGARAGRERFDQIRQQATHLVTDPEVRQKLADLPDQVRENLPRAQSVVSDAVKAAADKVKDVGDQAAAVKAQHDQTPSSPTDPTTAPTATTPTTGTVGGDLPPVVPGPVD